MVRHVGILFLAACLVVMWPGAGIAHWPTNVDMGANTSTGHVDLSLDGELHLEIDGCEPGTYETECRRFENGDLDGLPRLDFGVGTVRILGWFDKADDPGDHVGFTYEVIGGVVDLTMKSGNPDEETGSEITVEQVGPGVHTWINPACELNDDGTATCTPMNTAAISHIDICLTAEVGAACPVPPLVIAVLRNTGSVPVLASLTASNVRIAPDTDAFCMAHRLDVSLSKVSDGTALLHEGDVCDLEGVSAGLGVIDPGVAVGIQLSATLLPAFGATHGGTTVDFDLEISGTLWNTPGTWNTSLTAPASIVIDGAPLPMAPPPPAAPETAEPVESEPVESEPPAAEPPAEKPPAVEPPEKPPADEPAPPAPPDEEPPPPPPAEDPTPVPPADPEPVPPPEDPVPEPPPVEPPPEDPVPEPPPVEPPPEDPVPEPPPEDPVPEPPPEDPVPEPPPVEPPPEEPPPEEPPEEPAPPAAPAVGYVHLAGHNERIEGTATSSGFGDLRIFMLVNVADWASGADQILLSHWGGTDEERSFLLQLTAQGALELAVYDGGYVSYITDPVDYEDGEWRWLRLSLDADTGNDRSRLEVYSATDAPTTSARDVVWGDPDFTIRMDRAVERHPAADRVFKIGGHGAHAAAEMDIALIALRAELRSGHSDLVFASDWRADGAFAGNPPSRSDDAVPAIEWTLHGRNVEYVPSALAFVDWLPEVVLAAAPNLTTQTRRRKKTTPTEYSAGNPGIAGNAEVGGGGAGTLS